MRCNSLCHPLNTPILPLASTDERPDLVGHIPAGTLDTLTCSLCGETFSKLSALLPSY